MNYLIFHRNQRAVVT